MGSIMDMVTRLITEEHDELVILDINFWNVVCILCSMYKRYVFIKGNVQKLCCIVNAIYVCQTFFGDSWRIKKYEFSEKK